jgi:CubicO group peptidase (beta-lactamase class C family)
LILQENSLATSKKKPVAANAASPAKAGSAALDELFQSVNRSDVPGLVVGVAQDGKTLYRRGFGLASIEHAVANTPATRMRIGSVSKHFCCLAVLLLAEDGKLDVDAPASRYLPELPALRGMPTLRQFMNHTSGYRCYVDIETTAGGMAPQPAGKALAAQLQQTDANFAPGEAQLYCNGGYHLLSVIVDRVSGMSFEQFLKQRIFEPLGMVDTDSIPSDMQIHAGMATMHVPRPQADGGISWRRGIFMSEEVRGEGAIVSTVDDMLIWLAHLRAADKRVGSAETWRQMTTVARLSNGLATPYALGLFCHDYRGVQTVYHHGSVYGGMCQMLTVPEHALDIIIITNGGMVNHVELSKRIIDLQLAQHLHGDAAPKLAGSKRFKHLFGTNYCNEAGMVFGFADVGGKLAMSMLFSPPAPVVRDEGKQLRIAFEDLAMGPFVLNVSDMAAGPDGEAPAFLPISECGTVSRFKRLPAKPPSTARLGTSLVGRYRSQDLDATASIAFEGDVLSLRMSGGYGARHIVLEAVSSSMFAMTVRDELMPTRSALTVVRAGGAVTGFFFSSGRSRQFRFERLAD